MSTAVREPAVAGYFYPGRAETLLRDVRSYIGSPSGKLRAVGCVAPHAGYMYSGHVAGAVYARLELPRRFLILCPNHTGAGEPLAIMSRGAWRTPLGDVRIDEPLAAQLLARCDLLSDDALAHRSEHALEVQLPFLQALRTDFVFVPIAIGVGSFQPLAELGDAIAEVIAAHSEPVLIIASSDMNHYESDAVTRVKDAKAIEPMLAVDARRLYDVVRNEQISMCGFGPAVTMLTAAKRLGATQAELVKYATSGDVSGDRARVVGYAGIVVH
ncbi:MAG TPA: AmmeMemoRadiSam system protein B [Terriglobales bacterium]|nr:AmmeMemoRadiSam system protein B [Terriglobales bacterium]